jgi:hypothetical protein
LTKHGWEKRRFSKRMKRKNSVFEKRERKHNDLQRGSDEKD